MNLTKHLCRACESSGNNNRFCYLKACTELNMLKDFKLEPITKIVYSAFLIGSDYKIRRENEDPDFEIKRPSYYGMETKNGVIRFLLNNPEKKYIWVWKASEQSYKSVYIDCQGNVLDYTIEVLPKIQKRKPSEVPQRVYHLENVFELSINGEKFVDSKLEVQYGKYV